MTPSWMCSGQSTASPPPPSATSDPSPFIAGASSIGASVDRLQATVVDLVTLTIDVEAPPGVQITTIEPPIEAAGPLGDFIVASTRREPPRLGSDGACLVHRWVVELEPMTPGPATIPALSFQGESPDGAGMGEDSPARPATQAIAVEIRPILDSSTPFTPAAIRPPLDPVPDAPRPGLGWWWGVAGGLACAAMGAAGAMAFRPSPTRRIRRRFAPLLGRARSLPPQPDARARATLLLVREALTLVVGPRASAATPAELHALLASIPGVAAGQADAMARLAATLEQIDFSGSRGGPASDLDAPDAGDLVHALRQAALDADHVAQAGRAHISPPPRMVGGRPR